MLTNESKTQLPKSHILRPHKFLLYPQEKDDSNKFDFGSITMYLPIIYNYLQNEKEDEACYAIYALKNIYQTILSQEDGINSFEESVLNHDFISFLFQKITCDNVHPFFLKNILKIFCMIIEKIPNSIDQFLENNLGNILISLMPNKYASKCIVGMIYYNENYRNHLFQSQFHKQIFQMISNLNQMNTYLSYYFEKTYVDILFALNTFIQFDVSDYDLFLSFFLRNFSPRHEIQTLSQQSYINYLLKSSDPQLMQRFVYHPHNIIHHLLKNYGKPAYSKVRCYVLAYFEQIIQSSDEYATFFTGPHVAEYVNSMFNQEETIISVSHFIYTICCSSFDNCQNFITSDILDSLNFQFSIGSIEIKSSIYRIFSLLLRSPLNSSYYHYFSESKIFNPEVFFEFVDMVLQIENELKYDVLLLVNTLLDYITTGDNQPFLNMACNHLLSTEFYNIMQDCSENEDHEFADSSKSLLEKIESFQ